MKTKAVLFLTFVFSSPIFALDLSAIVAQATKAQCTEDRAFELGFNQGKSDGDMNSSFVDRCEVKAKSKLRESYRTGYEKGLKARPKTKGRPIVVEISNGGVHDHRSKCSDYASGSKDSCFTSLEGEARKRCEVCREKKSCFIALDGGVQRGLCQVYREGQSCFMALDDELNRSWCGHLKEKKSCSLSFSTPEARKDCENSKIPEDHYFWMN